MAEQIADTIFLDAWRPLWIIVGELEFKTTGLKATRLDFGGVSIGCFIPIFTSEKLAINYVTTRPSEPKLAIHPFVILEHFITFLETGVEEYVGIDFSENNGVFIRRATFLEEFKHQHEHSKRRIGQRPP